MRSSAEAAEVTTLEQEVSDAIGLIGLLLVFVVGYFSAVIPSSDELVGRPTPNVGYDRAQLANRLRSLRNLFVGLGVLIVAVLAVLAPLVVRVTDALLHQPYSIVLGGVMIVVVALFVMLGASGAMAVRVERRRKGLVD
jgi:hypothetical protein